MISYKQFTYIVPFINIILAMNACREMTKEKKMKKKVRFSPGTKTHDGVSTEKMLFCEHLRDVFQDPKNHKKYFFWRNSFSKKIIYLGKEIGKKFFRIFFQNFGNFTPNSPILGNWSKTRCFFVISHHKLEVQ